MGGKLFGDFVRVNLDLLNRDIGLGIFFVEDLRGLLFVGGLDDVHFVDNFDDLIFRHMCGGLEIRFDRTRIRPALQRLGLRFPSP